MKPAAPTSPRLWTKPVPRRAFLGRLAVGASVALGSALGLRPQPSVAAEPPAESPALQELKVGDLFPELKPFGLEGKVPETLRGKVAVVDFWASWCAPCQRTFPVMEDLHLRYKKQGLLIVAINVDKSRVAMEDFLKEHPVTFDVIRDARRSLVSKLRLPSLPATFVLDRTGRIRSICNGFHTVKTKREHVQLIGELLKAPDDSATATKTP